MTTWNITPPRAVERRMLYGLGRSLKPCGGKSDCLSSSPKFPFMRARERETLGLGFSKEIGGKTKSPRGLTSHKQHQVPCRQGGAAFTSPGLPTNGAQGQPSLVRKCLICVAEHIGMLRRGCAGKAAGGGTGELQGSRDGADIGAGLV